MAGLQQVQSGSIVYIQPDGAGEKQLVGCTPMQIRSLGVALSFVPEDRLGMGLVGSMGMPGNMMIRSYSTGRSMMTDRKHPKELSEKILKELEVVTPSIHEPVSKLSGGNVQKVLVGR